MPWFFFVDVQSTDLQSFISEKFMLTFKITIFGNSFAIGFLATLSSNPWSPPNDYAHEVKVFFVLFSGGEVAAKLKMN